MRIRKSVAVGAATAIATAVIAVATPLLVGSASAASNPPWEPDVNAIGTLEFFNSTGQPVTSGNNLAHLFDFAEASTADTTGGTKAEINFAQPIPNTPTGNFPPSFISGATAFPNASAPAPLNTATTPVFSGTATDANLANFIASQTAQTAPGYANVWQVRLYTTGPGGVGTINTTQQYWDADVLVNPTAGTWQEIYPTAPSTSASTTTILSALPTGSANQNTSVALTATVAASDSTQPAGSVQFFDTVDTVTSPIGSPVAVSYASSAATTGTATVSTSALLPSPPGGYSLTATFTPISTPTESYTSSTSAGVSYTVNPVATTPTISGAHQVGKPETCSEALPDFGVTATYAWFANTTKVGSGATFTVPASAFNKQLTCQASVSDGGGPANTATSASVKVSLGAALKAIKKPTLSGPHKVGKTETVHAGTWSQRGAKFTYQWLLNGKVIKHATKSTFKPTKADRHKKLSCRVTAHLTGFANGSATTSSVKVS